MLYIIIYLIGYVLAFYISKSSKEQSWEDIVVRAFIAIFSWAIVILAILAIFVALIMALCEKLPKPPKWL